MTRIVQLLDMTAGALCLLAALEIWRWWMAPAPVREVARTMRLDNGHIVHLVEPLADCKALQTHLADSAATVLVTAPWGTKYRVTDVWCGTYRPEEEQ